MLWPIELCVVSVKASLNLAPTLGPLVNEKQAVNDRHSWIVFRAKIDRVPCLIEDQNLGALAPAV